MWRAVAWKRPVVSHDVWVMVRDTIYAQHDTWKTTNFWKYKALEHHIIQTNRKNNKLNTFLPLCRAVAWKRPVVSHDVWVVRDTIYVQQTSCWLPWHMEKRLTVASSSALFWMFLSIIHGLNVPRLILLNFFFMIVFSLFSYEPILVFRSIFVFSKNTELCTYSFVLIFNVFFISNAVLVLTRFFDRKMLIKHEPIF